MTSAAELGYRYRAVNVDRRYLDWHYLLDVRCRQMDLDSIEVDYRTPAWLALVETTTNPEKFTSIMRWGAERLCIPAYLIVLPSLDEHPMLGSRYSAASIKASIIHWPSDRGPRPKLGTMTLGRWGQYIEQVIHGLPPKPV